MQHLENIIVAGGSHHNTLGVVRALGERGIGVELITIGGAKEHYVSSSRYVKKHQALVDVKELASYLLFRKPKENECKEIVISCADNVTEHLDQHVEHLTSRYILTGCDIQGAMSKLMDKTTMIRMANKHGLQAPKVWRLPDELDTVTYPCITKSLISSHGGKTDMRIFYNSMDLHEFLCENKSEVLAQKFIEKKEEVQFIGCSLRNGEEVFIPGMTHIIRSQPNTNTGFLKYGPIENFYKDVIENSKKYIRDCAYNGLFSIEFIRSKDDDIYFLEINFRNDGNACCVTSAGVNLPMIWIKGCYGEDYSHELKTVKTITAMPEFQDFKLVLQHKIGFLQWLHDVKCTDCFFDWNKKDIRPFFRFIINKIL